MKFISFKNSLVDLSNYVLTILLSHELHNNKTLLKQSNRILNRPENMTIERKMKKKLSDSAAHMSAERKEKKKEVIPFYSSKYVRGASSFYYVLFIAIVIMTLMFKSEN